jgi:outer membrane protein assembly factor BamA
MQDIRKMEIEKMGQKKDVWNPQILENKLKKTLISYQNKGYPFAKFSDYSIDYQRKGKDSILTNIFYKFDSGKLYTIDSIFIQGKKREKDKFVYSLMRFAPKSTYNYELIENIPRVLNNSIYYRNAKVTAIRYTPNGKANLYLQLEARKTNKFDILIGILPKQSTTAQTQFVGNIDLLLVSPLKMGESFHLQYDKLPSNSSKFQVKAAVPYLLRTPLQLSGEFLFFQQTEFISTESKWQAEYRFSPFFSVQTYYRNKGTQITNEAVESVYETKTRAKLTEISGKNNVYGLGFNYENLDYRFNPTKGVSFYFGAEAGKRVITPTTLLLRYAPTYYDTLSLSQNIRQIDISIHWYKKLAKRQVLHLSNHSFYLDQKQMYANDQNRVGGSKNLRGFNENQFYADKYSIFTAEYRFILEQNSFLLGFCDYGYLVDSVNKLHSNPIGFGIGMNYDTPAGIISITYAIGKVGNDAVQAGRGKIHIGLISRF